jgi:hypothetical protein
MERTLPFMSVLMEWNFKFYLITRRVTIHWLTDWSIHPYYPSNPSVTLWTHIHEIPGNFLCRLLTEILRKCSHSYQTNILKGTISFIRRTSTIYFLTLTYNVRNQRALLNSLLNVTYTLVMTCNLSSRRNRVNGYMTDWLTWLLIIIVR